MAINQLFVEVTDRGHNLANNRKIVSCVDFDGQLFSLNGLKIPFKDILHIARVIELEDPTVEDSDRVSDPSLRNG